MRIVWAMFALALAALFVALPAVPGYSILSEDAWTVYELAQTVGGDFFRASTVREYATGSDYSSAFAPLCRNTPIGMFCLSSR